MAAFINPVLSRTETHLNDVNPTQTQTDNFVASRLATRQDDVLMRDTKVISTKTTTPTGTNY